MGIGNCFESPDQRLPLPFEEVEYRDRVGRVRNVMRERNIDMLFVTSPANIYYLSNIESIWYAGRTPTGLAVPLEGPVVYFDSWNHRGIVTAQGVVDQAIYYPRYTGVPLLQEELGRRGYLRGTVAVENWGTNPAPPTKDLIAECFKASGASVVDGSFIVDDVRFVKSPRELDYIREAGVIADAAMEAVQAKIRPDVTELQLAGEASRVMYEMGAGEPSIRHMIHSGPRSAHHHGAASRRVLEQGDLVVVDFCAAVHRYHADLARTFAIGDVPRAREVLAAVAPSVERVVEQIQQPGTPTIVAQRIADEHLKREGLAERGHFIGGYALGVGMPPDWVGHIYLGEHSLTPRNFEPGVVMNYENLMEFADEGWGVGYIDTLLMDNDGLHILSQYPRELIIV